MRRKGRGPVGGLLPLLLAAALGIGALAGIGNAESAGDAQRLAQLEEALRRGAVSCYARTGSIPPRWRSCCGGAAYCWTRRDTPWTIRSSRRI